MSPLAQFFQTWGAMIQTIALIATLIVLAATLVVLIFYTVFTYQLRRATVKQTELQLTPYIVLDSVKDAALPGDAYLVCKNIGNTSALNVRVETFELQDKSGKLMCKVDFNPLYVIEPNEQKELVPKITYIDNEWKDMSRIFRTRKFPPFFPKKFNIEEYLLTVHYENLENDPFKTEVYVKIRERKIEILKIEKLKK